MSEKLPDDKYSALKRLHDAVNKFAPQFGLDWADEWDDFPQAEKDCLVAALAETFPSAVLHIPEKIADALREACYVPGHFDAIKHLNYCRWCHYEATLPHGYDCPMLLLLDPELNAAPPVPVTARPGAQGEGAVSQSNPGEPLSPSTAIASPAGATRSHERGVAALAEKWGPYQVIRDFGMALKAIEKMYGDCAASDQPRFMVGLQCASEAARDALDANREHVIPPEAPRSATRSMPSYCRIADDERGERCAAQCAPCRKADEEESADATTFRENQERECKP